MVQDYARDELASRPKGVDGLCSVVVGQVIGSDPDDTNWFGVWDRDATGGLVWTAS